jgi:hypothetical protein
MRAFLIAVLALALLAPSALAQDAQNPPKMPNSTKGTKKCGTASRFGSSFRVYLVKGKRRISCKRARTIVRKPPLSPIKGWTYFDWTKGGNGPWSDVYYRKDLKVTIGAIMREPSGR